MSTALQQCFVVGARAPQTHTIILLHGRGSTGEEFATDLFECDVANPDAQNPSFSSLPERFPSCRWIFPTARPRYSTVFQEEMNEWFDIYSLTYPEQRAKLQKAGLVEALDLLTTLIQEECRQNKLDINALILGGISQGFATLATFMMASNLRCAGFVGLSGWVPFVTQIGKAVQDGDSVLTDATKMAERATAVVKQLLNLHEQDDPHLISAGDWTQNPFFLAHEQHDTVVSIAQGEAAYNFFRACGAKDMVWHVYESGDHWIQEPDEINDLVKFLDRCIDNSGKLL